MCSPVVRLCLSLCTAAERSHMCGVPLWPSILVCISLQGNEGILAEHMASRCTCTAALRNNMHTRVAVHKYGAYLLFAISTKQSGCVQGARCV